MQTKGKKRYYWLKLKEDFFNSKEIKKLRKLAGGDTFTIIYLKMLLISINNDCIISYDGVESSFEEELALQLDEGVDNVKITVMYLKAQGLLEQIEVDGSKYILPYAAENLGSESASAERMRNKRERDKKLLLEQFEKNELTSENTKKLSTASQCDANVTLPEDSRPVDNLVSQCDADVTQQEKVSQSDGMMSHCDANLSQCDGVSHCDAGVTHALRKCDVRERERVDINNNIIPYTTTYVSSTRDHVDNFKTFVSEYPRKYCNFDFAKKHWNFLIKSGVPETDIVSAVKKYKSKVMLDRVEQKYIKKPENFLRDGTWLDYLPVALDNCSICGGTGYEEIKTSDGTVKMQPCRCTLRREMYRRGLMQPERSAQ